MPGEDASGDQPYTAADEPGAEPERTRRRSVRDRRRQLGMAALALGALGVVFGDIGTSPLYALQTVFSADNHAVKPTEGDVYGVISLVFWSITLIVSIEFVAFIMRADNDGEGGIMALIALVQTASLRGRRAKLILIGFGMFGVALFYGDGMITPAISVLSAVEGLKVVEPSLESMVLPITIAVIVALFAIQRYGTHRIGRVFGPVMAVWFAVLAIAGLGRVVAHPAIVKALSPSYGVEFFTAHPGIAFISLGSIVLTITGAEALYADMGHFGRPPISRAWFFVVFPALTLNYMGQGSLILGTPDRDRQPVLPPDPGLGADADDLAGDGRDDHRLAGGDLRGVLGHPPGGPARVPAAAVDSPHLRRGDRTGLRPGRQLGAADRGGRARSRLRLLGQPGVGVRRRRDRHVDGRHAALPGRGPGPVAEADLDRGRRRGSSSSRSISPSWGRT